MTLGDLKTLIRSALGARTDKEAELPYWIHWATIRLAERHVFREMEHVLEATLPASSRRIKVPATSPPTASSPAWQNIYWVAIAELDSGDYSADVRLRPWTGRKVEHDEIFPETSSEGKPDLYAWIADHLLIVPSSDAEYAMRVRVSYWPSYITNDGTSFEYKNKDRVIEALALAEAFQAIGQKNDAAYWEAIAQARMTEAVKNDLRHADINSALGGRRSEAEVSSNYVSQPFAHVNEEDYLW